MLVADLQLRPYLLYVETQITLISGSLETTPVLKCSPFKMMPYIYRIIAFFMKLFSPWILLIQKEVCLLSDIGSVIHST